LVKAEFDGCQPFGGLLKIFLGIVDLGKIFDGDEPPDSPQFHIPYIKELVCGET
jgi:hypothetical protein